ncbi:hypothetical protein I3760_07G082800 [Carya illinoinensis]|nr:hypothetical protein I3760_07G082800 [Carya illinoinensis]
MKCMLRTWNREVFGRVEVEIKNLEDRSTGLEVSLSCSYSSQTENELLNCKQEHLQWVYREEVLACQKSRVKWLAEGYANSSFFHATLRLKRRNKKIEKMQLDDGSKLTLGEAVREGAISFFQNLLTVTPIERNMDEMELIQPVVSREDNEALCAVPTLHELKQSLWSIPVDGSPSPCPDNFLASFFMLAWDIVKDDLLEMAKDFFEGQAISTLFGATNLVLIPKVDEPLGFN